ncbi:MAG: ABC transporter ATP-binding protein, partial [Emergencia timonensis]
HAVDGVSLTINQGETLGVVGESGCGKSTLGRTVLKLHEPTSGKIFFEGKDITGYKKKQVHTIRQDMQMIFQDPYSSLNPRMSVQDLIAEPLLINKVCQNKTEVFDKVAELMETVGLAERLSSAYPHELDGGRRQRIGVARALALNPKFIVCDEPVSALDVSIQAQILNLLMDLQDERNLTYMFITHDLSVVRHISDQIAVMYLGKCVELCSSKELFKNPLHPYTKALLSAIPVPSIEMRGKKPHIIKGEVTSPVNPKPGCRFAARCPLASDECRGCDIPFEEIEPGHFVSCCKVKK